MELIKRNKRLFIAISVLFCTAAIIASAAAGSKPGLLTNAVSFVISPFQRAVSRASWWIEDRVQYLMLMDSFQAENEELRARNAELEEEIKRLRLVEQENVRLSELYQIDQKYAKYTTTGAEIIARDPSDWVEAYTINKGERDGLRPYMAVLGPGGLFGMITECTATTSTIVSLLDDRSSIAAKCVRTEDRGFVKGESGLMRQGLCRMDFIEPDANIMVGDEIFTSSMSTFYPAGITIGTVREIIPDPNGLTMYAVIEPGINMGRLETVLIIIEEDKGK